MTKEAESINNIILHTKNRGIRTGSMVELNPKNGIKKTEVTIRTEKSK